MAVDGITAAGKSTFAAELTAAVARTGRPAVHLSTDDFHHVAARRRSDPDRARGYYRDAYDLELFARVVLDPLGDASDRAYRARSHDLQTDELLDELPVVAAPDAVVVVDGSFLQSAALAGRWDEVVFLRTGFAAALERAVGRDAGQFGGPDGVREAYEQRYHAACRLYLDEVDPEAGATVVVDVEDPAHPQLLRLGA